MNEPIYITISTKPLLVQEAMTVISGMVVPPVTADLLEMLAEHLIKYWREQVGLYEE